LRYWKSFEEPPLTLRPLLLSALLCVLPISELRGGLPFALAHDVPWIVSIPLCVIVNSLVGPLVYLFLSSLHRGFARWRIYARFFNRIVARARTKLKAKVDRYGYWGVVLFVAIPLPITGAYTGTLGAWVLGMERKKTILAVATGVTISGLVVAVIYYLISELGIQALRFFIRE
jgi:uncharacterized membrane protein